jgi:hypothetical protein
MPYSEYLIETLNRIAKIQSEPATIEARCATANNGRTCYPSMAGALESVVKNAAREAESALRWTTDHIVPAEREAERLVAIFENLGLDLDEETLATLELMGKDKTYRSEARGIVSAITRQVADVQYSERDYEQQNATEVLARAGFVVDDEGETWTRGKVWVKIELANGRESRYRWTYENNDASDDETSNDSGVSGEFHRLLVLIGAGGSEDASTGPETTNTEVSQ